MIVITGGAGFLGSNLAHALNAQDYTDIALVDNLAAGDGNRWQNINGAKFRELVPYNNLFGWLNENSQQVEAIVHLGGPLGNSVGNAASDMEAMLESHYKLSTMLWDWCTLAQRSYLYASSSATYGDGSEGFEDTYNLDYLNKLRPLTPYGFAKHLFDKWVGGVVARGEARPPQVVGLKFFNVFGPHEYFEPGGGFVAKTYANALQNEATTLFKSSDPAVADGQQQRDFIYVDDATDIVTWFLANPKISGMYNIGTGKAQTYFDVVNAVYQSLYRAPLVQYKELSGDEAARFPMQSVANISRLKAAGYKAPATPLDAAVQYYIENYLAPNKLYK